MQEAWVWPLGGEDPLEKEMSNHSSILAWRFHGQKSLADYRLWGGKESDMIGWLTLSLSLNYIITWRILALLLKICHVIVKFMILFYASEDFK